MMAITASGHLLPPYVVYRSLHLYPTRIEGGPQGMHYSRTKSGWFDDWFDKIVLPYFKNLPGKKVMIGENLSSHSSMHLLECCEQSNIDFVLLPPNATHLVQPLDVAFFAPTKKSWRAIWTQWKTKNRGCILKADFPRLLNQAISDHIGNLEKNINLGFKAYPGEVLKRLPPDQETERLEDENH